MDAGRRDVHTLKPHLYHQQPKTKNQKKDKGNMDDGRKPPQT